MISSGIQTTVPTKSQGTQCTLLKEMFVTSTPCASNDEQSDPEEEMEAGDDPLYVPDPKDERDKMKILLISTIVCVSELHVKTIDH